MRIRWITPCILKLALAGLAVTGSFPLSAKTPRKTAPAPLPAFIEGKVVGITDGDTLKVLDATQCSHKIRLLGIDAPEKNQPFGKVAKQVLSDLVFGKTVRIQVRARDRYKRILGKVLLADVDINLELLREGLVWHYKHYAEDQFPGDAQVYAKTEEEARRASCGLWAYPDPIAPWEWRHKKPRVK